MTTENREQLKAIISEVFAVEILEYYNKKLLVGDNKTRSKWRQERLRDAICMIEDYGFESVED